MEVVIEEGGRHEEGWSRSAEVFRISECGYFVESDVYTDGRDCDGRLSTEWHGRSRIDRLTAIPADQHGPARPRWEQISRGQRDYRAEAFGY